MLKTNMIQAVFLGFALIFSWLFLYQPAMADHCTANQITLGTPLENGEHCIDKSNDKKDLSQNPIFVYLRPIIRFLSAGVGLVVVLMIIVSGIQYITSGGNPQAVDGAKKRLSSAIIALVLFLLMSAILNFLIPGGLL